MLRLGRQQLMVDAPPICPAIRARCDKNPYPATRFGRKIRQQSRRKHRSQHITFYQQLQGWGLSKGRLHNGSQSFLSFEDRQADAGHGGLTSPGGCFGAAHRDLTALGRNSWQAGGNTGRDHSLMASSTLPESGSFPSGLIAISAPPFIPLLLLNRRRRQEVLQGPDLISVLHRREGDVPSVRMDGNIDHPLGG
jgi:hypothetical protein